MAILRWRDVVAECAVEITPPRQTLCHVEGETPLEHSQPAVTPALIVAIDDKRIVYFAPGESQPKEVPMVEWAQHFEPVVWALKHNTPVTDQDHPAAHAGQAFGFRWFVPEILKHKAILRDVLIASAVLMLMGIGTLLLTQVIFDKVVVHETQSTLMVVTSALAILLVFNALMTWLRQYLVIHTGNRIDAVLGEKVFRHLLRLPMLYFQHRPTGTVMARLHGVETIREFLTGAAVTLLLDFLKAGILVFVLGILTIVTVVPEPLRTGLKPLVGVLFVLIVATVIFLIATSWVQKAGTKQGVVPPPEITLQDEQEISKRLLFVRLLGNHWFVMLLAPLVAAVLVDLLIRSLHGVVVSSLTYWTYYLGIRVTILLVGAYAAAAKVYSIRSGLFLSIDSDTFAKKYFLFVKESGLRKTVLFIVLLMDVPVRFGVGWTFVAGPYFLFLS